MAATDDPLDDPRLTAAGLLFEAHQGLVSRLEPAWRDHGLSGLDLNALLRLGRSPGRRLRMTDLATQTALSTSGVTRLVDRLTRAGLVRRDTSPADRRTTFATLTPEGEERLREVLPTYLAAVDRWLTGLLPPDELDAFLKSLRVIRDRTNPAATARTP
ncbi:MarR family winged helix-turn-helix transcriptional regulator [Actinomadura kijaniata]|uniref:MarR family winged helix-turn-helix transcriptional regulator n=1 Tax=Actinomadura kijaniata TaxID=46161 RepID=UPI000835D37D|nr:MarR family transcriptional regulator [Actinomadura kijaniata]